MSAPYQPTRITDADFAAALDAELARHKRNALNVIEELRALLLRIEKNLNAGQSSLSSSSQLLTELYCRLGQYDQLVSVRDMLAVKLDH